MNTTGKPRVLVLGASGLLGGWLCRHLSGTERVATGLTNLRPGMVRLDITDREAVNGLLEDFRPDTVYMSAAVTSGAACEADPDRARVVNTVAARLMAHKSAELGFRLIFISSDLVFDGRRGDYREEDEICPLSCYGRTKADAEAAILGSGNGHDSLVVRAPLIIGSGVDGPAGALAWTVNALASGRPLKLFSDEFRTPITADELARCLVRMAGTAEAGLWHVAGPERLSRVEMGKMVCRVGGWDPALLRPTLREEFDGAPPRPEDVSLNTQRIQHLLGDQSPRPFSETVDRIFNRPVD